MAITSYSAQVERALWIKNKSLWCAIGGTAPWPNEALPPSEMPGTNAIDTPISYVRPGSVSLAVPVSSGGNVTISGQTYALISDANAQSQFARFIYVRAVFDPGIVSGLPYSTFRQYAVYSGLVPTSGHENDQWLAPASVSDPGILEYFAYLVAVSGPSADIEIIIECR